MDRKSPNVTPRKRDSRFARRLSGIVRADAHAFSNTTTLRKTKVVCTLGAPSRCTVDHIRSLIRAGMNVARLNFSHGDHKGHGITIGRIREAAELEGSAVAILLDTKGPEIRTGMYCCRVTRGIHMYLNV